MNEITVIVGEQRLVIEPGRIVDIGRRANSDLRVDDPRVSREHLRVSWGPQGWTVECIGRSGSFVNGQLATQFPLTQSVDVHLAVADGPLVRFEVPKVDGAATVGPADSRPAEPSAAMPGVGSRTVAPPATAAPVAAAASPPVPAYLQAPAVGSPAASPGQFTPAARFPAGAPSPGANPPGTGPAWAVPQGGPSGAGHAHVTAAEVAGALRMLVPVKAFFREPGLRQWLRILVAVYAIVPLILLIAFQHSLDLKDMGWAYCLYIAPLWAIVFYFLVRPGRITWVDAIIGAIFIGAELVLIPALTIPWENSLAPGSTSHNLFQWIYGVGLAEELTKALPIAVVALVLLHIKHTKLDARMWIFLGTISGLMFGVYEASTNYVPGAFNNNAQILARTVANYILNTKHATVGGVAQFITADAALGIPSFIERVFLDGLQHAVWVGITAFFIGLGANYSRQRIPLWIFGLLLASVLHGLNDWSVSGEFGNNMWPWIGIQAFSVFLFLGYTASARSIERAVRHNPLFRGDSMAYDTSVQDAPTGSPEGAVQPS